MRTIQIDFTQAKTSVGKIGYVGEHNQTEIVVTPPVDLSGDENVTAYRIAFGTGGNKIYSETYPKADTISCLLWQQLTGDNTLEIQLEGYDDNGDLIAKSALVYGFFSHSVGGTDETADFTEPLIDEITANTLARHTHANKAVLDEITVPPVVEISTTATTSKYTPNEINALIQAGCVLTYQGLPVVAYGIGLGVEEFAYYEIDNDGAKLKYKRINNVRHISDNSFHGASTLYVPLSVNGKKFETTNAVTLQAGDISAASGWSPSADTDLATKKYVDDNGGGATDWDDITNKPTFATVATSGDYDDLLNKPTIPAAQVQADWNEADNTALDYIKNKPATMPPSSHTHTKSDITDFPSLATVATSGSYNDLLNQPTIPDISGCEVTTNKVTALSVASTDTQYPSAKCVYDLIGDVETILADLIGGA
ncbi:MAG: hypothetical protein J6S85_02515 [Methanobrevibacter sp.]|nr:hypothetical protein [Methanobrevibacter sp.]